MPLTAEKIDALIQRDRDHCCEGYGDKKACVQIVGVADLPTRFGVFQIVAFTNKRDEKEHAAIVRGDVTGGRDVLTRIHSECLTGDVLGSYRCDCRDQLESSLRTLGQREQGLLLYLRQEGRGIGLINKIRAYGLQDQGLDTVEANLALGFRDDERDYAIAAHMINSLDIRSITLMTNNPKKIRDLERHGIEVTGRVPLIISPNEHNRFYLETKATKSGHWLDAAGKPHLAEQSDPVVVDGMPDPGADGGGS